MSLVKYSILLWYIVSLGYVLMSAYVFFFWWSYVAELWLSFLPYWMWWGGVLVWGCLLSLLRKPRRIMFRWIGVFLVCALAWYVIDYGIQYRSFYDRTLIVQEQDPDWLSFLYANIYYKNGAYDELMNLIKDKDPDVLLFVEYAPHHHRELYTQLQKNYPYINHDFPETSIGWRVIYAKYPLQDLSSQLQGDAMRKYGFVRMEYAWHEYVFYLIHTSAPSTYTNFVIRNRQLEQLVQDLQYHTDVSRYGTHTIMVGDFNVSPWSLYYQHLSTDLQAFFVNITRSLPWLMTRSLGDGGIVASHIDHVWVKNPETVRAIQHIPFTWSDHDALFVVVWTWESVE